MFQIKVIVYVKIRGGGDRGLSMAKKIGQHLARLWRKSEWQRADETTYNTAVLRQAMTTAGS